MTSGERNGAHRNAEGTKPADYDWNTAPTGHEQIHGIPHVNKPGTGLAFNP